MNAIGAVAILALILAGKSIFDGYIYTATFYLVAAAFLGIISIFLQKEKNKSEKFIEWVIENIEPIKAGTARYKEKPVTRDTSIVQFQAAISVLILTVKSPSRFYIKGHHSIFLMAITYSIVSLILGWWGIPWGPIYTLQAVFKNLTGGYEQKLGDIIDRYESLITAAQHAQSSVSPA